MSSPAIRPEMTPPSPAASRPTRSALLLAAPLLLVLLLVLAAGATPSAAAAPGASGSEGDAIIPMPGPPRGPAIRRVRHDALKPVLQGARVQVTVLTEAESRVQVRLGSRGERVDCRALDGDPGTYRCSLTVPAGLLGRHHVIAEVTGPGGRTSRLSSLLPVEIRRRDPWSRANALNARLRPVYFQPGEHRLTGEARAALQADLEILRMEPEMPVLLEVHCDSGEAADIQALSERRGEAVAAHLEELGVPRQRLTTAIAACDETLAPGMEEVERALNRRVMVLLQPTEDPPES